MSQGKGPLKFGPTEKRLSLNWASLVVSIVIAILTWFGVEAIPELQAQGGKIAALAGLLAQLIPVIVVYLKSNQDIIYTKPGEEDDGKK